MPDKKETVAIRVEGSKNVRMEGNVSVGFDKLAHVSDSENITAKNNLALTGPTPSSPDVWFRRPVGMIGIGLFVTIVGGLFLAYAKGWIGG